MPPGYRPAAAELLKIAILYRPAFSQQPRNIVGHPQLPPKLSCRQATAQLAPVAITFAKVLAGWLATSRQRVTQMPSISAVQVPFLLFPGWPPPARNCRQLPPSCPQVPCSFRAAAVHLPAAAAPSDRPPSYTQLPPAIARLPQTIGQLHPVTAKLPPSHLPVTAQLPPSYRPAPS